MMQDKGLETLLVWQKAMNFTIAVLHDVLPCLPLEEKWSLSMQLRRSSQSIPANIAEGYGRYYYQECVHFCYIARGSLEEAFSQITLAYKLDYISQEVFEKFNEDIQNIRRLLNGYIGFLKKSKRGENEPGYTKIISDDSIDYSVEANPEDPSP